jgi:DNA-binding transcriptional LysR family regulator
LFAQMKPNAFDLNLLSVVVALDETRSVTRAAQNLGMSQPGLSSALARLRRHFGDPMFVRTSQGMRPTPRGVSVAEEARAVLQRVHDKVLSGPRFVAEEAATEFRLAMPDVGEMVFLPALMDAFRTLAPQATIRTTSYGPQELELAMETGQVDIALGYFPDLKSSAFFKQRLRMHGFSCLMRTGHPAAKRLTRALFSELEHVVVEAPTRSQELVENYLDRRNIFRKVRLRSTHYLTLPVIVASSDLVATVPTAVGRVFADLKQIVLVEPPYDIPKFPIQQHWHRRYDQDPRNRWLREQLATLFGGGSSWKL